MAEREAHKHETIPEHKILSKDDSEKIISEFKVSRMQIPKIKIKDAALIGMGAKAGQIVQVTRKDGSVNYRLVIES